MLSCPELLGLEQAYFEFRWKHYRFFCYLDSKRSAGQIQAAYYEAELAKRVVDAKVTSLKFETISRGQSQIKMAAAAACSHMFLLAQKTYRRFLYQHQDNLNDCCPRELHIELFFGKHMEFLLTRSKLRKSIRDTHAIGWSLWRTEEEFWLLWSENTSDLQEAFLKNKAKQSKKFCCVLESGWPYIVKECPDNEECCLRKKS